MEFSLDSEHFYIGSDNARLYKYSLEKQEREGDAFEVGIGQFGVNIVYLLHDDTMVVYIKGKGVRLVNYTEKKTQSVEI